MHSTFVLGNILAILVGISLGLVGSGGSILAVPILVYIMGIEPVLATAYSLFTVGITALVGGIQKANQHVVDFRKVLLFGIPSVIGVFATRKLLLPNIPDVIFTTTAFTLKKTVLVMLVFAIVMLLASSRMIKPIQAEITGATNHKLNYPAIFGQGLAIGLIAGFVGAGGGFLIIPALFFLAKTPMKIAIGTSLFIVTCQSLLGFLADIENQAINWTTLITFTSCSVLGVFIGNYLSKFIAAAKLKTGFGWFILVMAVYIVAKELAKL